MKFANDYFDLASAPWETYNATKARSLSGLNGTKTVHAFFRNAGGVTGYVSDTIILTGITPPTGPLGIA